MKIYFDKYEQPIQPKMYLATPNNKPICPIAGFDEGTFQLTQNIGNTWEISFTINRYIDVDGVRMPNFCYSLIDSLMRIHIDNIGWFVVDAPNADNNGAEKDSITVTAQSSEIEFLQHDVTGFKANMGTTDSYEMLVEGNVDIIDEVEFAKEQIKFCNKENPELSLLHILLKISDTHGWSIGYIDTVPKKYKYYDNGELKEKSVLLSNEIGVFDIPKQNLYSLLTQDVAQFFQCIFVFDFQNFIINAYRPENLGKDTNINIGFRNLQESNNITVDRENFFTRYTVYGADDLGIRFVNFGSDKIENLQYFLNEKYMSSTLINKYKLWQIDVEVLRPQYIEKTRLYNEQQKVISELIDRVPLDDCSTDWSKFDDEKLLEAQANYQAQLKGYEQFYVDEDGNFDQAALDASPDANDYYQIRDVILPSIQIEIDNRNLGEDEKEEDYIDSYKTDWKLYGLDELQVKLDSYKNTKKICEQGGYDKPYTEDSDHTKDTHDKMYEKYLDAVNQLNPDFIGSCAEAYAIRKQEVDDATAVQKQYDDERKDIVKNASKETWTNGDSSFTKADLSELSKFYIDTDYTNPNMFLTNSDDSVSAIDEQLKLLNAAEEDLDIASQLQFIYSTNLDNFLALYEYKNYTDNLNVGDFIYLGVQDDNVVKLRVISISYNPMTMDNNLQITFSNMIRSKSGRYDTAALFGATSNRGKNSASGSGGNYLSNGGIALTPGIINKLLSSAAMTDKISQIINDEFGLIINGGGSISIEELNAKMIKVVDLIAENGFFEYLQAKLIFADAIVSESAKFGKLSALVAQIDNLLAGNISAELGHLLHLTAENAVIDEAVILNLIAGKITVDMLNAGLINTDKFHIVSNDGGIEIVGNTMQFKDTNDVVRIQIGRDANNDFTFCLYDETGKGVLIDSTGIKESAISDGTIHNDMLAGGISKDKLGFNVGEFDENGNLDIGNITIDGKGFESEFISIKESVTKIKPFTLSIQSSNGRVFSAGRIDTYLIPYLYYGTDDVTEEYSDFCFIWTRQSSDSDGDRYWNQKNQTGTKKLHITSNDVVGSADFTCSFTYDGQVMAVKTF